MGFKRVKDLWIDSSDIPDIKGVYLVLTQKPNRPDFINPGVGPKLYKKKTDPNVRIEELKSNWVNDTLTVYIGKAGGQKKDGSEMAATLKSRIKTYLRFGQGNDVRHYGGRYIWQLANHNDLIFCWRTTNGRDPRELERNLISDFKGQYVCRPFANLTD